MLPQIHKPRSTLCLVRILITPNEEKTKFYSVQHKKAPRSTVAWLGRHHIIIPNSFCYFSLQSYRNPQGFLQLSRSHAIMLSPYAPLSLVCGYLALCFPGGKKYFCITLFILFTKKKKKYFQFSLPSVCTASSFLGFPWLNRRTTRELKWKFQISRGHP